MMRRSVVGILVGGSMALVTADAHATTILPNCGTCGNHNTAWDLTLSLINDAENIYQLTVTATYGNPVDFDFVNAVAFKIDAFTNNYDAVPTVTGPAESSWGIVGGGISASGCSGSGNGFFCANSPGAFGASPLSGPDVWTFLLNVNNSLANVLTPVGSFKAHYTIGDDGEKIGSLLSEAITLGPNETPNNPPSTVPEPTSLLLFGTGLAAAATALRRRRKA